MMKQVPELNKELREDLDRGKTLQPNISSMCHTPLRTDTFIN